MAKPKITRLNDPANPYNQKKIPTGRPQDKPKPRAAAPAPRQAAPAAKPKGSSLMQGLNDKYGGGARARAIDSVVDAAVSGKKKK